MHCSCMPPKDIFNGVCGLCLLPVEGMTKSAPSDIDEALWDVICSARARTYCDEDCGDQDDEFKDGETCECGAVGLRMALDKYDSLTGRKKL